MSSEFFVSEVFFEVLVDDLPGEFGYEESLFFCCGVEIVFFPDGEFYAERFRESGSPYFDGFAYSDCRYSLNIFYLCHSVIISSVI